MTTLRITALLLYSDRTSTRENKVTCTFGFLISDVFLLLTAQSSRSICCHCCPLFSLRHPSEHYEQIKETMHSAAIATLNSLPFKRQKQWISSTSVSLCDARKFPSSLPDVIHIEMQKLLRCKLIKNLRMIANNGRYGSVEKRERPRLPGLIILFTDWVGKLVCGSRM